MFNNQRLLPNILHVNIDLRTSHLQTKVANSRARSPVRLHFPGSRQGPGSVRELDEDICHARCKWGKVGMVFHTRRSSTNLLSTVSAMYSSGPVGGPRIVIPPSCHTTSQSLSTLTGTVPDALHTLVFPSCNWMLATLINDIDSRMMVMNPMKIEIERAMGPFVSHVVRF